MQRVAPASMIVGQYYTSVRRANPGFQDRQNIPLEFVGLSNMGHPRFAAGHGATKIENPAVFDFFGQKSLANVYRNKGTEFGVRNIFERAGMTGYNPAANLIVKQATGVKYTPNPYLPGGKRKPTRKHKRRHSKRTRKH